jgi:hypothetical protein
MISLPGAITHLKRCSFWLGFSMVELAPPMPPSSDAEPSN